MLTQTLRGMESDGLLRRTVYPTVPTTVEYALTDLGESLIRTVEVLREWAYGHMGEIEDARREFADQSEPAPSGVTGS
jgi:DNA-binding HxlR family transcriptional regulator